MSAGSLHRTPESSRDEENRRLKAQVRTLEQALSKRIDIDRAKCLLMEKGLNEQEAYARLRNASMKSRTPLIEVAKAVVLCDLVEHDG